MSMFSNLFSRPQYAKESAPMVMTEATEAFHTEVQRLEGFIDSVRNLAAGNKANIDEIANLKGQIAGLQTELAAEQATNADLVAKLKAHNDMLSAVVAPAQTA